MKRPSFQFYPGDWLRDTALRSCSISARGLWIDMLCLMHEGNPYGYLKVNLKVILETNLARMTGLTLEECQRLLSELEDAGVFSRDEHGCIYSRRMVQDEETRQKRAAGGIKGGNPKLLENKRLTLKVNLKVEDSLSTKDNQNQTPSSSSSSSKKNILSDFSDDRDISKNGKSGKKEDYAQEKAEIIDYLNELRGAGTGFRPDSKAANHITARLKEGYSVEDCKEVIRVKVEEWRGTEQSKYLRPETLFNSEKFEGYLVQSQDKKPKEELDKLTAFAQEMTRKRKG